MESMIRDVLIELLADLQHDLGKYIRQPIAFLPLDAGAGELQAALAKALHSTRQGARGIRSARQLWESFLAEAGDAICELESFGSLRAAVERALGWEIELDRAAELDRARVEADVNALAPAILAVLQELRRA